MMQLFIEISTDPRIPLDTHPLFAYAMFRGRQFGLRGDRRSIGEWVARATAKARESGVEVTVTDNAKGYV